MLHELKTDPDSFDAIWAGDKTCEIRYDDRGYALMDELILRRTLYSSEEMKKGKPLKYTGEEILAWITHILRGPAYGLSDGYILASIRIRNLKLI